MHISAMPLRSCVTLGKALRPSDHQAQPSRVEGILYAARVVGLLKENRGWVAPGAVSGTKGLCGKLGGI